MATEGQDASTNRQDAVDAGASSQPSATPRMSPPMEAIAMPPPGSPRAAGWATAIRVFALFTIGPLILWLMVSILSQFVIRQHESARRIACPSNLKAIAGACLLYSEANRSCFPGEPDSIGSESPEAGQTCIVGFNGLKSDDQLWGIRDGTPVFMGSGSNPRRYFRLLKGGNRAYLEPRQFICPSAAQNIGHRRNGTSPEIDIQGKREQLYDFNGSSGERPLGANCTEMSDFSYSFQVATEGRDPEAPAEIRGGSLSNSRDDPRKALAADRNPYSNEVQSRSELIPGVYGMGTYIYSPNARTKFAPPPASYTTPKDLTGRNANSRNHNQDGQNVVYIDGHTKWATNPLAGADEDCIWMTLNNSATGPRIPLTGDNYGRMRSKVTWSTDSLLIRDPVRKKTPGVRPGASVNTGSIMHYRRTVSRRCR